MSAAGSATRRVDVAAIARNGAIAAVVAAVLNAVVARIGATLFDVPDGFLPLQVGTVVAFTVFAVLIGTVVYALLLRSGRDADRLFPRIAWGFALLTLLQPLSLLVTDSLPAEAEVQASVPAALVLGLLHLIPAAVIVALLTRSGRSTAP